MSTARAALGTLAVAVDDPEVAEAVLVEGVGTMLGDVLASGNTDLVHRALVFALSLLEQEQRHDKSAANSSADSNKTKDASSQARLHSTASKQMIEGGVVASLSSLVEAYRDSEPALFNLVRQVTGTLAACQSVAAAGEVV